MARATNQTSTGAPIPHEAAIDVQEARAGLAGVELLLNHALGVGSSWEWRPLADALEQVELARDHLQRVNTDAEADQSSEQSANAPASAATNQTQEKP